MKAGFYGPMIYDQQVNLGGVWLLVSATGISDDYIPQKSNTLTDTDHDATRHLWCTNSFRATTGVQRLARAGFIKKLKSLIATACFR